MRVIIRVRDKSGCISEDVAFEVPCSSNLSIGQRFTGIPGNWLNVPMSELEGGTPVKPRTTISEILCQ